MDALRRILCPVDFSEYSRHALDYAVAMARWFGAHITVLYVSTSSGPILVTGPFIGTETMGGHVLNERERAELEAQLETFVSPDRAAGAAIETVVTSDYSAATCIVQEAQARHTDLIAMGTHGRSGLDRLLLGSVAERVLRKAQCPVLTVPHRVHETVPAALDRLVCAVDFSPRSATELEYAVSLAERTAARVTVLHVIDLPPEVPDQRGGLVEYRIARFEQARGWMRELILPELRARCPIDELLLVGTPSREIVRVAEEQQADVVVMGAQGRGALNVLVFGSTTQHVVRSAACPVLTVR